MSVNSHSRLHGMFLVLYRVTNHMGGASLSETGTYVYIYISSSEEKCNEEEKAQAPFSPLLVADLATCPYGWPQCPGPPILVCLDHSPNSLRPPNLCTRI